MSHTVREHFPLLEYLLKCKRKPQTAELLLKDKGLFKSLCEICLNILNGNLKMRGKDKEKLKKYKKTIRHLGDKKIKQKPHPKKILRGGFLSSILSVALPFLAGLFKK